MASGLYRKFGLVERNRVATLHPSLAKELKLVLLFLFVLGIIIWSDF